jgi:hypothetical protein
MMKKYSRGGMPPIGDSVASGNRMSKENTKDTKAVAKTSPRKPPMAGMAAAKSAARVGRQEGAEMRKMGMKKGGMAKKRYAEGGMASAGLDLEAMARRGEMERELGKMDFSTPKVEAPAKKAAAPTKKAATPTKKAATPTKRDTTPATFNAPEITVTGKRSQKPAARDTSAREKQITKERENSFFKRPLTPAETRAEASKKPVPAPSVTRNYAGRGARTLTEREKRVAKNAATEAGRAKKPNIFKRMYDMTVNPGVDMKYAKGGSVTRGDGIARKGKTKGRII